MKTSTIEDLAYLIKEAKEHNLPKPIVFLGAGASKTGGIPLASEIIDDILDRYKYNPGVKKLVDTDKETTYPVLMECLTPSERNNLLKEYVDKAKINVTHIYLAQLINEGYVDYVLTVNFDNLMLRALALYNEHPPTYDMAILKDMTTTTFIEKSVVYLHGQHHGLWLLNTPEELKKVKEIIPPILHSIKDRIWIFIGYSGNDPIFRQIVKLGRFDKGLYWVSYNKIPNEMVCKELLDKANTNSLLIKDYDADSFMIKLNNELSLEQPLIIEKPFTTLKISLDNLVDIDDKEHFKGVKQRLEISRQQVNTAIEQFELRKIKTKKVMEEDIDRDLLAKQIIDKTVKEEFNKREIQSFEEDAREINDTKIFNLLANLYFNWGNELHDLAKLKKDEVLFKQSFEKYEKATSINPKNHFAFNNWGIAIKDLAKLKKDEMLFKQSFEKYEKATSLNPKNHLILNNWGNVISELAKLKKDEMLFKQSFEKYEKATSLNPKYDNAFNNWGNAISRLANLKKDEILFKQSFEKYEKATSINPKNHFAFNNWGIAISDFANLKKDEVLFKQSFEKYEKATSLNPKYDDAFDNWGVTALDLAKLKKDDDLIYKSIEILEKGEALSGSTYNLACAYTLLKDHENALKYLENSLIKKEIAVKFIKKDEDWKIFKSDVDFLKLLKKY